MKRHFNILLEELDIEFWYDLIIKHGRLMTYRKGEYICRQGERTNVCGYVKSGYLIYGMTDESRNSDIGGFAFTGALCGDYPNYIYNKPASLDLVTGSRCEVWVMDATILPRLFQEDITYSEQGRLLMESAYNSLLHRYNSLCVSSPAERYVNLIKEHPQIEQDVPQIEIARYLHISPVHLCRIRKSLLNRI